MPQVRGIVAPPGIPADASPTTRTLFARLAKTATWKKYLEDNQFEDGFQKSAAFGAFIDRYTGELRGILGDAGIKLVR